MNYCDTCIHREVCGEEDAREPAITYCAERIEYCDDCISRKEILNLLDQSVFRSWDLGLVETKIKRLQSVLPKKSFEGKTNGEVLEELFNVKLTEDAINTHFISFEGEGSVEGHWFNKEWWYSPYEKKREVYSDVTREM